MKFRQWALYLGRPQMIKADDITTPKPEIKPWTSDELRLSTVWADLMEVVGIICDALYVNNCDRLGFQGAFRFLFSDN